MFSPAAVLNSIVLNLIADALNNPQAMPDLVETFAALNRQLAEELVAHLPAPEQTAALAVLIAR